MIATMIDRAILGWMETYAHKIQKTFGLHPFWVVGLCYIFFSYTFFSYIYGVTKLVGTLVAVFMVITWIALMKIAIPQWIKETDNELAKGHENKYKIDPNVTLWRLLGILLVIMSSGFVLSAPNAQEARMCFQTSLSVWIMVNFLSVTPLPPGKSKARKFLDRLKNMFRPIRLA